MTPEQTKRFKYWQTRTIIATMVGYALFYFVRKNRTFRWPCRGSKPTWVFRKPAWVFS